MRSNYKLLNTDYPYFITSTIVNWIRLFDQAEFKHLLFQKLIFYQSKYEIEIIAYVIMPDHFHMICKSEKLRKAIQSLKSYSAKEIIDILRTDINFKILDELRNAKQKHKVESNFQVWQEGYHPQEMLNNKMLKQKIEYIHFNPVRKGLVSKPEDWKYSSAGYYTNGTECDLKITRYI